MQDYCKVMRAGARSNKYFLAHRRIGKDNGLSLVAEFFSEGTLDHILTLLNAVEVQHEIVRDSAGPGVQMGGEHGDTVLYPPSSVSVYKRAVRKEERQRAARLREELGRV